MERIISELEMPNEVEIQKSLRPKSFDEYIGQENLKKKVKEKFPFLQMFFTDKIAKDVGNTIKDIIMGNQEKIFEIFSNYAEENIDFEVIISDKISNFSLDKLEEIITFLAKKELKHIEVIGAILGGLIGVAQYLITLIIK